MYEGDARGENARGNVPHSIAVLTSDHLLTPTTVTYHAVDDEIATSRVGVREERLAASHAELDTEQFHVISSRNDPEVI